MSEVILQKLRTEEKNELDLALKYYSIISIVNDLKLSKRQIQLLAFTSIRETITPISARKEFVAMFNSSLQSIENIKGSLAKAGLMVVKDGKYRVNPLISLNFSNEVQLNIKLLKTSEDGNKE